MAEVMVKQAQLQIALERWNLWPTWPQGTMMALVDTFPEKFHEFLHPRSMPVIRLFPQSYMICWLVDLGQHSSNLERHTPRKTKIYWRGHRTYFTVQVSSVLFPKIKLRTHPSPTLSNERNSVPTAVYGALPVVFKTS